MSEVEGKVLILVKDMPLSDKELESKKAALRQTIKNARKSLTMEVNTWTKLVAE